MTMGRILLLPAVLALALAQARAAPLDADSCAKLLNEHGQLEQAGVEADMAKGPEWAKANLIPEKLERIRRFIEIEGQLLFRCRQKSLVSLPSETEPADDSKEQDKDKVAPRVPSDATEKTKAPPAGAKKKSTTPAKKAAAQPAAKPVPKQTKQPPGAAKPPAKAKAAAKQPAGANAKPAPSTATEKRPPKAKVED
jgi:outer membrane biosynthesis protein TonB